MERMKERKPISTKGEMRSGEMSPRLLRMGKSFHNIGDPRTLSENDEGRPSKRERRDGETTRADRVALEQGRLLKGLMFNTNNDDDKC